MNAAFVARMEDVLVVYERPDDPRFPVVCFDERPCVPHVQPVEPVPPVPAQLPIGGQPAKAGLSRRESSTARFEVHYTPKNASWLSMVELEPSAIARQCLHQRIPTLEELTAHVAACVAKRNAARATVHWQFTLEKARTKFDRHYQKVRATNSPDQALAARPG